MKFRWRRLKNRSGQALIQALMLVSMVGLVSAGLSEYSRYSNTSLNLARGETSRVGVGELYAGLFKSQTLCNTVNMDIDTGSGFGDAIGSISAVATAITSKTPFPLRILVPAYDDTAGVFFPKADPTLDPMLGDYGLAVGSLNIVFKQDLGAGASYSADVIASFLAPRGLFSGQLSTVGKKKIASIVLTRNGNNFQDCVTQGTAADFCSQGLGCNYISNSDGTEACLCGVTDATCPNPDEYLSGLDAAGDPICVTYTPVICPTNQYLVKINPDGSPDCRQWPFRPCTAAPGTLPSWTNAGSGIGVTCTNSLSVWIPPGGEWPVGDLQSADGAVGRAYFACPYPSLLVPNPTPVLVSHNIGVTPQECVAVVSPSPSPTMTPTPTPSGGPTATPTPTGVGCTSGGFFFTPAVPCGGGAFGTYYVNAGMFYTDSVCTLPLTGFVASDAAMTNYDEYTNGVFVGSGSCAAPTDTPTPTPIVSPPIFTITPTPTPTIVCNPRVGTWYYKPSGSECTVAAGTLLGTMYIDGGGLAHMNATCVTLTTDGAWSQDSNEMFSYETHLGGSISTLGICLPGATPTPSDTPTPTPTPTDTPTPTPTPVACTSCTYSENGMNAPIGCIPVVIGDFPGRTPTPLVRCVGFDLPLGCSPDATCPGMLYYCNGGPDDAKACEQGSDCTSGICDAF